MQTPRTDWLRELQGATGLLLIALVVVTVGRLAGVVTGSAVHTDVPAGWLDRTAGTAPGVAVDADTPVEVRVTDPHAGQRVAAVLMFLPTPLAVAAVLVLLYLALRRARGSEAFARPVIRLLRAAGFVALFAGPLAQAVQFVAGGWLSSSIPVRAGSVFAHLDTAVFGIWALVGVGLLAVAELVNRGRALRVELDQVI